MEDFKQVISTWPTNGDLASDVDVPTGHVAVWRHRNSIPVQYWIRVVAAAKERRYRGITLKALAQLAETKAAA